jgi:hypothetical protein
MSDQVADVLDDAADWLETHEWLQGRLSDPEGARVGLTTAACALGSLHLAWCSWSQGSGNPAICSAAYDAFIEVIDADTAGDITDWNDEPGRTKQQVLDTFRAAAKQERMRPETPAPPRTPGPTPNPRAGWGRRRTRRG